jgi:hypothetical protein
VSKERHDSAFSTMITGTCSFKTRT